MKLFVLRIATYLNRANAQILLFFSLLSLFIAS